MDKDKKAWVTAAYHTYDQIRKTVRYYLQTINSGSTHLQIVFANFRHFISACLQEGTYL